MKEVTVTIKTIMTEGYFEREALELESDIKSGKLQREMMELDGVNKCTVTIHIKDCQKD